MPLISLIIPVYNVENYLDECINSILNQTYQKLEIILIDDGSTDNSPSICDEYAKKDPRIIVIHKQNGGLSSARNAGIEIAHGKYLCFVDSDDVVHPQYCELLLKHAQISNSDICCCKVLRFDEILLISEKRVKQIDDVQNDSVPFFHFFTQQIDHLFEIGVWNRIYKLKLFDNIRFKNSVLHEDIFFSGDLFDLNISTVATIDCELYYYRQRQNSIIGSQLKNSECNPDRVSAGDYIYEKAKANNFDNLNSCLSYALDYPWSFVDGIYVHFKFKQNKVFLRELKRFCKKHANAIKHNDRYDNIKKHRIKLFSRSLILYGLNAYTRLLRVYVYHILKKDAYTDGHGI